MFSTAKRWTRIKAENKGTSQYFMWPLSRLSSIAFRHESFFGTSVSSARVFLRHESFFGTSVSSARVFLRHERFFARGKVGRPCATRAGEGSRTDMHLCQAPGKPLSDSSQIFARVEKPASCSVNNQSFLVG